jgi:hypothetical protein
VSSRCKEDGGSRWCQVINHPKPPNDRYDIFTDYTTYLESTSCLRRAMGGFGPASRRGGIPMTCLSSLEAGTRRRGRRVLCWQADLQ